MYDILLTVSTFVAKQIFNKLSDIPIILTSPE